MPAILLQKQPMLAVKIQNETRLLPIRDVIFIESAGRKVTVHTTGGTWTYYQKMSELEEALAPFGFFRVHKGYLVNLKQVLSFDRSLIRMRNGESVPISKYRFPDFWEACMRDDAGAQRREQPQRVAIG